MPQHVLYAYIDGSDLDAIADVLEARFTQFVESRRWRAGHAFVVNQRSDETATLADLPDWDLGLNLELPDSGSEPPGWFEDVEAVAQFLAALHVEFERDFILGIADMQTGLSEDLFDVSSSSPDLNKLRAIIGVREIE